MLPLKQNNKSIWLVSLAILISRIPFIYSGYGSEEDAWGLILVARNIDLTGIYEVSRMPGHPVQELLLSYLWKLPSWTINLMTSVVSTIGILFFMLTLRLLGIRSYLIAGIFLAFVPVYYVNSTNVMDYTWAMAFVLASLYFVCKGNILAAGLLLGIACGFRITAGAMVIPFCVFLYYKPAYIKQIVLLGITTTIVTIICFIPAFLIYGKDFFTYYEYFPYPPILKNIYKATIGAWGIPGMFALGFAVIISMNEWLKADAKFKSFTQPILLMCITVILLYTYAFLRIPQKSAFVIPMIPFIIIIFSFLLTAKQLRTAAILMFISCFLFGLNLDDKTRGSKVSALAIKTTTGSTSIALDPLIGIVTADHFKRLQKIQYARNLVIALETVNEKIVIISGWWQNELNYFSLNKKNNFVSFLYYADENQLNDSIAAGNKIFYLPEQDYYNDIRFKKEFTKKLASPFEQLISSD